jgi:hypothetical protein
MSPERRSSSEDEIVSLLSSWLAFHRTNEELRAELGAIGTDGLDPGQADALDELVRELASAEPGQRGDLEMLVRETLEVVALGG